LLVSPAPLARQLGTAQHPLQKGDRLTSRSDGLSLGFGFRKGSMGPSMKGRWARMFFRGSKQPPNPAAWELRGGELYQPRSLTLPSTIAPPPRGVKVERKQAVLTPTLMYIYSGHLQV